MPSISACYTQPWHNVKERYIHYGRRIYISVTAPPHPTPPIPQSAGILPDSLTDSLFELCSCRRRYAPNLTVLFGFVFSQRKEVRRFSFSTARSNMRDFYYFFTRRAFASCSAIFSRLHGPPVLL